MKLISCRGTIVVLVDNDGADNRSCEFKLKKAGHGYVFQNVSKKRYLKVQKHYFFVNTTRWSRKATTWIIEGKRID